MLMLLALPLAAQTPALTTVKDTVYRTDGTLVSGTVVITWQAFLDSSNKPVFGGSKTLTITNGALAVALVPNAGAIPAGTSYNVQYFQSGGVPFSEVWVVPTSSPLANPAIPVSVTQSGSAGSTTYYYWCTATNASGETLLSPARSTATSNATLSGSNYNIITCATVTSATGYKAYRTTTSTAPSGTGLYLVGSSGTTTINDQSNTLSSATIPTLNTTAPVALANVRVTAAPSIGTVIDAQTLGGVAAAGYVRTTRNVNTTSPITGGSNLGGDLTLACATCIVTNGIALDATRYSGANAGAQIQNACNALPTGGGVIDARGVSTNLSFSSNLTCGSSTKPITVILGSFNYAMGSNQILMYPGFHLVGQGRNVTILTYSGSGSAIASYSPSTVSGVSFARLEGFEITNSGSVGSTIGIALQGSVKASVNDVWVNGFNHGIDMDGTTSNSNYNEITNNYLTSNTIGIYGQGDGTHLSWMNRVVGNLITGSNIGIQGLGGTGHAEGWTINNNQIVTNAGTTPIMIDWEGIGGVLIGNWVEEDSIASATGIKMRNAGNFLSGNTYQMNGATPTTLNTTTQPANSVILEPALEAITPLSSYFIDGPLVIGSLLSVGPALSGFNAFDQVTAKSGSGGNRLPNIFLNLNPATDWAALTALNESNVNTTVANYVVGIYSQATGTPSSVTQAVVAGVFGEADSYATSTGRITNLIGVIGQPEAHQNSTGTEVAGLSSLSILDPLGTVTVQDLLGVFVQGNQVNGNTVSGVNAGVYILAQAGGAHTYGIDDLSGNNYFGGKIGIGISDSNQHNFLSMTGGGGDFVGMGQLSDAPTYGCIVFNNTACAIANYNIASDGTNLRLNALAGSGVLFANANTQVGLFDSSSNFNVGSGSQFQVNGSGVVTKSNNVATAGQGAVPIRAITSQKSETAADTNVLTLTPPAAAGKYRIHFVLDVSAANTATLGWTATWTDSNGHAQAPTNLALTKDGTAAPALTFSAAANDAYTGEQIITINNSATNIVIKLTFSGTSFTAKASATIEQII